MICTQGEIISVDFEPSTGHEPNKFRPAIVVSCDQFNLRSSLTVVAPITSTNNGYPLHLPIRNNPDVTGYVCMEQLRSVDLSARRCHHVGRLSDEDLSDVLNVVGAVFGI